MTFYVIQAIFRIPNGWYVKDTPMTDSKKQILDVALTLFLKKSYKEVSIQEIADIVGMTKGAFYYHFKSKEELFSEIVNRYSIMTQMDFSKIKTDSLHEFVHSYFNGIANSQIRTSAIDSNQSDINYYFLTFEALKRLPDFREKMWNHEQKELDFWINAISNARKKGEIKSVLNDKQIAEVFIYTGDGIGMRKIFQGRSDEVQKAILELWNEFYKVLKA